MKNPLTFLSIFIINCLYSQSNSNYCTRYNFNGILNTQSTTSFDISFTLLLDSTLVGSYYYNPAFGSLKIVGHLYPDNSFRLYERDKNDSITGEFYGILYNKNKSYKFSLKTQTKKTHWDYIHKNRNYYEYRSLEIAFRHYLYVRSLDLSGNNISSLPKKITKLKNIESLNLLANEFQEFPEIITELNTLDELSLSSNNLKRIPYSIGKLTNLRILYLNFNNLIYLPKSIGKLHNLIYLDLSCNKLKTLPTEIKNLSKLQELNLEQNNLSANEKRRIRNLLPQCLIHF